MLLTRYTLKLEKGDWEDAHFELRINATNRPFHIVLRKKEGQFALNSLVKDVWGDEQLHKLPATIEQIKSIIVEVSGKSIHVLIGGELFVFTMPESQQDHHLIAASKDISWTLDVMEAELSEHQQDTGTQKRLNEVTLNGKSIKLPKDWPIETGYKLAQNIADDPSSHLNFLTSHLLTKPGQSLTILDIEPNTMVFALRAALLLPNAKVLKLPLTGTPSSALEKLVKTNNLTNIQISSMEDIVKELSHGETPILLQGGLAFKALGDVLDNLPPARRQTLSIWSATLEIVPGNRVLPCANVQLWSPPNWALKHNAAIDLAGRRPGVDVTIAAYNAKDYLIECAESLLCEGRDDVRVIIVDDGSSDGSGEMAAKHFKKEPRVRVEPKPNGGCASARNYGRLVSDATHIAFVDADDFVTPGFFGDLYDLALYSGCEVTQGGFDFYDASLKEPYYPSYEEELFKDIPRQSFKGQPLIHLHSADIIKGQPTIWRKVYRRDFLDAKNIYFPENVRAYDDYIFQMLTLTAARDILMMPKHLYHYRQHPAQDIKQGDERHFYMLFMFQMLLERSIAEGWSNFRPYAESITDSIAWSASILKPELVDSFLEATARFCVAVRRVYGPQVMSDDLIAKVSQTDFQLHFNTILEQTKHIPDGVHWGYFNGPSVTPEFIRMRQAMKKAL